MLSPASQKLVKEEVADMLPRVEKIKLAARSGGTNEEHYIKTRCEQIAKMLQEIDEKV